MRDLADALLPQVDISDPAFGRDPFLFLKPAQDAGWLARYSHGYLVLEMDAMKHFLRDDVRCRPSAAYIAKTWEAEDTLWGQWITRQVNALSGRPHARIRQVLAPLFTPRAANEQRQLIRRLIDQAIDRVAQDGRCDNFLDLASEIPVGVVCTMLGIDPAHLPEIKQWLDVFTAAGKQDRTALPLLEEGTTQVMGFIRRVIAERIAAPGVHDDFIERLVATTREGEDSLTVAEVEAQAMVLITGAYGNTLRTIAAIVYLGACRPEQWAGLDGDSAAIKHFIEESVRFMGTVSAIHRLTVEPIEFRDLRIPAQTLLSFPLHIAGRATSLLPDADSFDPDRDRPPHLGFGFGPHMCVGQFIARAILEESVAIMSHRLTGLRLDGDPVFSTPLGSWGLDRLPLAFNPAHPA